jgi:hypothetical protein
LEEQRERKDNITNHGPAWPREREREREREGERERKSRQTEPSGGGEFGC